MRTDKKKEFKELLESNIAEINRNIEALIPKKLDSEWLDFAIGKTTWQHDEEACSEAIAKPIWDLLERGGKRWRPLLMWLSYKAVKEVIGKAQINEVNVKKFAILPELIHNGTLIIDDIEDNSSMRRGKPCLHKLFPLDIALNAGNALYYLPCLLLIKDSSLNSELKARMYEIIDEEMIKISFGQAIDIYWHNGNKNAVNEKQYLQMCALKTGALARMSAKLGALLGNANHKQIEAFGKFAESIGVAFQIQDDILNITNKEWGKDFGEDIKEGKRTLIIIKVLEKAAEEDRKRLLKILGSKTTSKTEIKEAIAIIKKYKAIDYAKNKAKEIVKNAWQELNNVIGDSEYKQKLRLFADYLINRDI
jgi:geranylgeranyl pyrophosphate synthase